MGAERECLTITQPDLVKITYGLLIFPGPVRHATLKFFADGLSFPRFTSDKERSRREHEQYFAECEKRGIIPAKLCFESNMETGEIIPAGSYSDARNGIETYDDIADTCRAVALAMKPGRVRVQQFKLNDNFNQFKETLLPALISNGYRVGNIDLGITWYYSKHGCYDEGGYEYASSLRLHGPLELRLDDHDRVRAPLADLRRSELKGWFSALGTVVRSRD